MMGEIYHYGVKGMKWGERKDAQRGLGSSPLGKSTKDEESKTANAVGKLSGAEAKGKTKAPYRIGGAKKALDSTVYATDQAKSVIDSASKMSEVKRKKKLDLSSMSDQELQRAVNRMNMERSYSSLINDKKTSSGAVYARETLNIIGSVAAIGASVIGAIVGVKQLIGK